MRGSGRRWIAEIESPAAARLALWYVALIIPTLFFKIAYLRSQTSDGLASTLATGSLGKLPVAIQYLLLVESDLWQVLVIVAIAFIVGCGLLRIQAAWVVAATLLAALLVSTANWISFQTVGTLATWDNVLFAVAWIRENPAIVTAQRTDVLVAVAAGLLVVIATLWSVAFFLLARYGCTKQSAPGIVRSVIPTVAVVLIGAAAAALIFAPTNKAQPESFRGYWGATAASLVGSDSWQPFETRLPTVGRIDSEYQRLVFPNAESIHRAPVVPIAAGRERPAHIVIVSLETAPRKYYDIVDNRAYPTFFEMGKHALVSDHHYTTMPATTWAIYSIVSGTYPRLGRSPVDYGDFATDGLAAVLGRHGYETTYIDSYRIDWNAANEGRYNSRMLRGLGFANLVGPSPSDPRSESAEPSYEAAVAQERASLVGAMQSILAAEAHGTKAMVFVATILGHYPWRTPTGAEGQPNGKKLALMARDLDSCVGEFLRALQSHGLADDVVVVVTGDHGFRTRSEFASVGENLQFGDSEFNVPLLLYAPGVLTEQVRVPYVTSHVDIAPTLLALVGIHDGGLLHGSDMLDGGPCGRTTFMMNNTLRPIDGFYRAGAFYVLNRFSGDVHVSPGPPDPCSDGAQNVAPTASGQTAAAPNVAAVLARAAALFDTTAAYFLQRRGTKGA